MKIPDYMFPKFYNYVLVNNNKDIIQDKDLKLCKNLKLSKEFKNVEKKHLFNLLECKEWYKKKKNILQKTK